MTEARDDGAMRPEPVLDFWFDRAGHAARGESLLPRRCWWEKDPAFDAEIRIRFGDAVEAAIGGNFGGWQETAEGALALLILLDQFPRNLFRGDARAFAGDERARTVAYAAIGRSFDVALPPVMRQFLYMPFEHSENLADHDVGLPLFAALDKALPGYRILDYAEQHRAIIARFGRYPHRNAAIGRASTREETAFLAQPGSSF